MNATWVRSSLAGVLCIAFTVGVVVAPGAVLHHRAPIVQTVLWMGVVLGTLVALLAYGRFRRSGALGDLGLAVGVALLAWSHTLFGTIPDMISPKSVGNGVSERVEFWGALGITSTRALLLMSAVDRRTLDPVSAGRGRGRGALAHIGPPLGVGVLSIG